MIRIYHEWLHVNIRLTFLFLSHLLLLLLFIKSIKETMSSSHFLPLWIFSFSNYYHVRLSEILACWLKPFDLISWFTAFQQFFVLCAVLFASRECSLANQIIRRWTQIEWVSNSSQLWQKCHKTCMLKCKSFVRMHCLNKLKLQQPAMKQKLNYVH